MKRFVYIPPQFDDPASLEDAKQLSESSNLQIMHGNHEDGVGGDTVRIIAVPTKKSFACDAVVKSGFIHSIDINDEFVEVGDSVFLKTVSPSGVTERHYPKVREKHLVKFRNRFYETGLYSFSCIDEKGFIYYDGQFEVV